MEVTWSQLLGNIVKGVFVYVMLSYFFQGWLEIFLIVAIVIIGVVATVITIGNKINQRYYYEEDESEDKDG